MCVEHGFRKVLKAVSTFLLIIYSGEILLFQHENEALVNNANLFFLGGGGGGG